MIDIGPVIAKRAGELAGLKAAGRKVVAFFPGEYVPEELIFASGAIPLCLVHGGNPAAVEASTPVTTRFLCPFARAQMGEMVLKNNPFYSLVDIIVSPITCQHLRRAGDVWEYFGGVEVFRLGVPYKYGSERGLEYYLNLLRLLKKRLEDLTGNAITDDRLRDAIALYNRLRGSLKDIGEARKADNPPVGTMDFLKLNHMSFYLDPEETVRLLAEYENAITPLAGGPSLLSLPRVPAAAGGEGLGEADLVPVSHPHLTSPIEGEGHSSPSLDGRDIREGETLDQPLHPQGSGRLLLTGPNVGYGDYRLLETIEQCGGNVVVEEIAEGTRYYRSNVATEGSPLRALAVKYLQDRAPAAFMRSAAGRRSKFLLDLARDYGVEGVIWYQLLYCDTYDIESYYFERQLVKVGLPMLRVESDYSIQDTGTLHTRVEAFIESIRQGR